MKGNKIKAILLITVFILTTLVIAIPVSAAGTKTVTYYPTLETMGTGTAEWEDTTAYASDYSVKLYDGNVAVTAAARVVIPVSIDFDDITDLSFYFYFTDSLDDDAHHPYLILAIDTDSNGEADEWVISDHAEPGSYDPADDTWLQWNVATLDEWHAPIAALEDKTLVEMQTAIAGTVVAVKVAVGETGSTGVTAYIDDIVIAYDDGTPTTITVDFEQSIILDYDYYKMNDVVKATVFDIALNTRPTIKDIGTYIAVSDYPDQITVDILETGSYTSVFEGTFNLVDETPGVNDLLVKHGDSITVYYESEIYSSTIDAEAPSVTITEPDENGNITDTHPWIKSSVSDDSTIETAWMMLDGMIVATGGAASTVPLEYEVPDMPIEATLTEGIHTVLVYAIDTAGNVNQTTWNFNVDSTEPTCDISMNVTEPVGDLTPVEFLFEFDEDMKATPVPDIDGNATGKMTSVYEGWLDVRTYFANYTVNADFNGTVLIDMEGAYDMAGNLMVLANMTFYIDTLDPTAPNDLEATMYATSVVLTWNASIDVGSGMTLYNIYDGTELVGTVGYPTATYTHTGLNEAASLSYKVGAVDLAGNELNSSALAVEFTPGAITEWEISLEDGWNLISLPLIPDDSAVEVVLADILDDVVSVWSYDEATGGWQSYSPGAPSDLSDMVDGDGYWLSMSSAATLTVHGDVMPEPPALPPTYDLYAGWNLIGFKSLVPMTAGEYLGTALEEDCIRIYGFDYGAYFGVGMAEYLDPGLGYWIAMAEAGTIYP